MDIKLNKGISIILIFFLFTINFIGIPVMSLFIKTIHPDMVYDSYMINLLIANLEILFSNLDNIIIGIWLFSQSKKYNLDNWTWMTIGLIYGNYSLIFFSIVILIQGFNSTHDLYKSFSSLLVILIISFLLNSIDNFVITQPLKNILGMENYGFVIVIKQYLNYISFGIMILMNFIFALLLYSWMKSLKLRKKIIWIIATIFFGIFPLILFNELSMIKKINKNTA